MNVVRDGILLIAYCFIIILIFLFTCEPFAQIVASISAASDATIMKDVKAEVIAVYGMCICMAVLIPVIIFIWMAFTTRNEEVVW